MKTIAYKRVKRPGTAPLCEMHFNKGANVILDFGKENGGSLKLPMDFLADSVEHYLEYIIKIGIKSAAKN